MDATVAQMPDQVGQFGVKYALQVIHGQSIPTNIPTGVKLITQATLMGSR